MSEIYRKRGSVARWEDGTIVLVDESGIAIEDGDRFECRPEAAFPEGETPAAAARESMADSVRRVAESIRRLVDPPLDVERLLVIAGSARHECGGRGWSGETRRIHLSLVKDRMRVLLDLGSFDLRDVEEVAHAFARCEGEYDAPPRLRLAPRVAAALVPSLVGIAPPNVALWQSHGGVDGKGYPIEELRIVEPPWPNWFRPSYRVRPLRTPLDLRLECDVTAIDEERPRAVALLAPVDGLTMRVLVEERRRAYAATVRVTRIDAVAAEAVWYPYAGGSFGAEMML